MATRINKIFRIIIPGLIILGAIGVFASLQATAPAVESKPNEEKVWPVSTINMAVADIRPVIREFGTVVAGNQADLRPLVAGRVVAVGNNYFEGAVIKKGETLVSIDPFDYQVEVADRKAALSESRTRISETKAELASESSLLSISKSQLALRERDLNRRRKLFKQGSTSRKSLDDGQIAFNDAAKAVALGKQKIQRLKNRLDQYQASASRARSALKLSERNLQETKLEAPFNGFLANAEVSVGQFVGNTDRLARLIESDRLEVRFKISERDFGNLLVVKKGALSDTSVFSSELIGKNIAVRWRVGERSLDFDAVIERLGAEIDASSGGVDIYARLLNVDMNTPIRPGAFVEVVIPAQLHKAVIRIPGSALVNENHVYFVEAGRLEYKSVNVVRRGGDWVLIRGSELEGHKLVTRPFPEMAKGLKVDPR